MSLGSGEAGKQEEVRDKRRVIIAASAVLLDLIRTIFTERYLFNWADRKKKVGESQ